jgi:RNA polymerase sigma factor (sigma-70 family)
MSAVLIETWYHAHSRWLANWLQRKSGCHALAADLLHDTFVRLLRRAPGALSTEQHPEPRAFLCTIAKGLLVDHWRKQALESAFLAELAQLPEPLQPSEETRCELIQTLLQLDRLLERLPPLVREAFLLSRIDGLAIADIAVQLKVSRSSVEKYLAQALVQCLSVLDDGL